MSWISIDLIFADARAQELFELARRIVRKDDAVLITGQAVVALENNAGYNGWGLILVDGSGHLTQDWRWAE